MTRRNSSSNVNRTTARSSASKSELKPGADVEANAGKAEQLPVVRQQNIDESANNGPGNWVQGLLGAMSDAVRPIASLAAKPTRRTKRTHSIATPVLAASGLESLEKRALLTALVNQLTIAKGETVVLDETNIHYGGAMSFLVSNVTHGQFEKVSVPGTAVTTFTPAQISGGEIQFVHDDSTDGPDWKLYYDDIVILQGPFQPTITFSGGDVAPEITSDGGDATASISVAENSEEVTTVEVSDDNLPDDTLTFSISGGDDAELFSIDAETGVLTFVEDADFEAPGDTDSDNVYSVHVTVTDSANLTDEQELEVTVTDANESADVKLTPSDMPVLDKQDTTDGVIVGSFSVADPDDDDGDDSETGSAEHVVSLIGDDADFFSLDGTDITFAAGVLDAATKPFYSATLRVEDGANTVDTEVRVNVLTLQQQIDRLEDGDTLTLIPGTYAGFTITDKVLDIVANGVTIQGVSPALTIDNSTVTISGMVILDSEGAEVPQPEIVIKNAGSLTLVDTTVRAESDKTLALISFEDTSTLDLSSGDNVLDATDSEAAFVSAAEDSEVIWDDENTLSVITNEDEELEIDVRLDGSEVVNLFTNPETKGFVIVNDDGPLTFTPEDDFSGTAWFDFELSSGLTGTVEVSVRSVNDQPSFVTGDDVTVDADVIGEQTVEGHIDMSLVDLGSDDENDDQSPSFTTSVDNEGIFATAPSIDSEGNLTFELDEEAVRSLKLGEEVVTTVSVTLHDDGGTENGGIDTSETLTFTITIVGTNDAPVADEETNSGDEDDTITGTLSASDVDHDSSFTFSLVDPVPGLTINSDGTYSLDASDKAYQALKQGETLDVVAEYRVTDEHEASSISLLTITLVGTNDAPVAVDDLTTGSEDDTITGNITPGDIDHDAVLTYTLTEEVEGLTLNSDGSYSFDTSSEIYQSLNAGETLDVVAEYTVMDEHESSSTGTLTITLTGANDAPVVAMANEPGLTTSEDRLTGLAIRGISVSDVDESSSGFSVTLSVRNGILSVDGASASSANVAFTGSGTRSIVVSGTATNLNRFLAATGGGPRGRSVTSSIAGITYSPDANYNSVDGVVNSQGAELLTVVASDDLSAMSSAQTKTITVTEVNDAPTGNSVTKSVVENTSVTFNVLTAVSPGPAIESPNQTVTLIGGGRIVAAHGFVTINIATGVVTYRPASGYVGTDTFSFRIRDNGTTNGVAARLTNEVTVTMTVLPGNRAPVITSNGGNAAANISVAENSTTITSVTAFDSDLPAQTLTYSISGGVDAAVFAIDATTGVLTLVSEKNFESPSDANANGVYEVDVRVSDGSLSDTQSILVTVTDINESPTVTLSNVVTSLIDLTSVTTRVHIADIVITDDALGTEELTVTGVDAASFEIVGTSLYLKAETVLNATAKPSYSFAVQADDGTFVESASGTLQIKTSVPTILGPPVSNVGMRPTLTWSAVPDLTYEITLREVTTATPGSKIVSGIENFAVTGASYTPASALGIGQFNFSVRSVNAEGIKSAWSSAYTFNVTTSVTVKPLAEMRQLVPRPSISWEPLDGAVKYDVWVDKITDTALLTSQWARTEVTGTSWTHTANLPIGRYRIWVRGADESGTYRQWSSRTDFIVAPAPVVTPISSTFDRTPTLTWTSVAGAVSYEVVVKSTTNGAEVFRKTVTGTSATPTTDIADGSYNWLVRAIGADGYSSNFTASSALYVGGRPVANPVTLSARIPTFSWSAVQGAATYQIRVDRLDVAQTNVINLSGLKGTSRTHTSALTPGTYRFWVRAVSTSPSESSALSVAVDFTVATAAPEATGTFVPKESLAILTPPLQPIDGQSISQVETSQSNAEASGSDRHFDQMIVADASNGRTASANIRSEAAILPVGLESSEAQGTEETLIDAVLDELIAQGMIG